MPDVMSIVALDTAARLQVPLRADWPLLTEEDLLSPPHMAAYLDAVQPDLTALGVPFELVAAIHEGLREQGWDDAVAMFSSHPGEATAFYLGPMRVAPNRSPSNGMLLMAHASHVHQVVSKVEESVVDIGDRIFGYPCHFHGRRVEFYDVIRGAGPFIHAGGRCIALFTPAYLGGWTDHDRQHKHRRTILFHNIIRARFDAITRAAAAERLLIDESPPAFITCDTADIDQALALWLSLHELVHGSGPLPLFDESVGKMQLGLHYAAIEEFRVDATVWWLLQLSHDLFGDVSRIAQHVILAERLFRSARLAPGERVWPGRGSDAQHGALWLALLLQSERVRWTSGDAVLRIESAALAGTLKDALADIYSTESAVTTVSAAERQEKLVDLAGRMRRRLFGLASDGAGSYRTALSFVAALRDHPSRLLLRFV